MSHILHDVDEQVAAVVRASPSVGGAGASAAEPFQMQVLRNMIEEAIDDFKDELRQDVFNLQIEMLKQFQLQQVSKSLNSNSQSYYFIDFSSVWSFRKKHDA